MVGRLVNFRQPASPAMCRPGALRAGTSFFSAIRYFDLQYKVQVVDLIYIIE